jgi:hypothetical protein
VRPLDRPPIAMQLPPGVARFPSWASMRARWRQRGLKIELSRMTREARFYGLLGELWARVYERRL